MLLRRRSVFAAKLETTVGDAIALGAGDGVFNARDFLITPNIPVERREGQGGFNYHKGVPGGMQGTCVITHDIAYSGSAIPNWMTTLMPACGYVATGTAFNPISAGPGTTTAHARTLTIGHYHDGKLRQLSGAMGNAVFSFPTGMPATVTFTFTGKYTTNETDDTLIAPTYPTDESLRFADGSIAWAGENICTSTATIDLGNQVIMRECAEAANRTGFKSAIITNRQPVITADPEAVLVATQNRDSQWLEMTTGILAVTLNGSGNSTLVFNAPAAQLENKQQGSRNDMITDDLTWLATKDGSTADRELTITFTHLTP